MLPLVPAPHAVTEARRRVLSVCSAEHVDAQRCDAALLVTSELVGNAVRHGAPPLAYDVALDDGDVLVVVEDSDDEPPGDAGSCPVEEAEGGRGLFLVGQLARRWGWDRLARGKRVWARL